MKQKCTFNPSRDIEMTVPELAGDVAEIMETGVVVSTGVNTPYSNEDDVHAVGHYITDKIQGMMAIKAVNASLSRQAKASAAAAAAAAAPAAAPAAPSE